MSTADLYTASWKSLSEIAEKALRTVDLEVLRALDDVFHHLFFHEARRGDESTRSDFIAGILTILESEAMRKPLLSPEAQRLRTRWEHLDELMDAFRRAIDPVVEAERLVRSSKLGERLLQVVKAAGGAGVIGMDLAAGLHTSPQNLAKLLVRFERKDIIERHSAGRNVRICLGLVGELVHDRLAAGSSAGRISKPGKLELPESAQLSPGSRVIELLRNPRQYLQQPEPVRPRDEKAA